MKSNFHIFRGNDNLKMQENFIFVDTETKTNKINKEVEQLKFKLGCAVYWDKEKQIIERTDFFNLKVFWEYVNKKFDFVNEIIFFAHNTDFDFKILNGFKALTALGFEFVNWYVNGTTFILRCERGKGKNKQILHIWDTMNYVSLPLKTLGKSINLKKLNIDFSKNTDEQLLIYCRRDTEIIFRFIQYLIKFLEDYNLSKLKPTSASLSLNIFRHQFYNKKLLPIYIHDCKKAIKLERNSYSGGITDCFKVGKIKQLTYKLDINSMYPYIMKNFEFPVKLIFWGSYPNYKRSQLKQIFKNNLKNNLIIVRAKINLPSKYAYILQKVKLNKQPKSIFLSGSFETVLTTPEIKYVQKYGKIEHISEISVYEKANIFENFVNFFYDKRLEFKQQKNYVYERFCKLILNSQYGKWGQKKISYIPVIKDMKEATIKNYGIIINAETGETFNLIQFGKILFRVIETNKNSKDAFVAISSFVTAYARLLLIKYLLICKRENCFYCDTDSLFVNKKGIKNLKQYINSKKLGFLKLEETSNNVIIYKPKFYVFGQNFKCKGVKRNSEILEETEDKIIFKMFRWERFKTSLKTENLDSQIITQFKKDVSKIYDKGIITKTREIKPYTI